MGKILVAGASGAVGSAIVKQLAQQNIPVRGLVRSEKSKKKIENYTSDIMVADATDFDSLEGVGKNITTVISAMGKSVSLFTKRPHEYDDVDFKANAHLLRQCIKDGVKRMVYISIFGAEHVPHLTIASAHLNFEDLLTKSGMDHTIIRPVGFFSGYNDLVIMGKKGIIPVPGDGESKTNSIHPADLAEGIVQYLEHGPSIVTIGGPKVHTRNEMAEMISKKTGGKIVHVPDGIVGLGLILNKFTERNTHDKLSYFHYVTTNDMVADNYGKITFLEYLSNLDLNELP